MPTIRASRVLLLGEPWLRPQASRSIACNDRNIFLRHDPGQLGSIHPIGAYAIVPCSAPSYIQGTTWRLILSYACCCRAHVMLKIGPKFLPTLHATPPTLHCTSSFFRSKNHGEADNSKVPMTTATNAYSAATCRAHANTCAPCSIWRCATVVTRAY